MHLEEFCISYLFRPEEAYNNMSHFHNAIARHLAQQAMRDALTNREFLYLVGYTRLRKTVHNAVS